MNRRPDPVPAMPPLRGAPRMAVTQEEASPPQELDLAALPDLAVPLAETQQLPPGWHGMASAPTNRSLYLSDDPVIDPNGTLAYWRTTRVKVWQVRGWQVRSYWAAVLNRRAVGFVPVAWREAMPAGKVAA